MTDPVLVYDTENHNALVGKFPNPSRISDVGLSEDWARKLFTEKRNQGQDDSFASLAGGRYIARKQRHLFLREPTTLSSEWKGFLENNVNPLFEEFASDCRAHHMPRTRQENCSFKATRGGTVHFAETMEDLVGYIGVKDHSAISQAFRRQKANICRVKGFNIEKIPK